MENSITELSKILRSSNGIVIVHINPKINGFNKRTITISMGISDYDYYQWLTQVRSFYKCDLLLEVKSTLF